MRWGKGRSDSSSESALLTRGELQKWSDAWIAEHYYGTLTEEISHALDQLHQATNWGITLITAGVVALLARSPFGSYPTLAAVLGLAILNAHFMNRALKGYLNVIRFGLIQKAILAEANNSGGVAGAPSFKASALAIQTYHVQWRSPLQRRSVLVKGLTELGFGYIYLGLAALFAAALWNGARVEGFWAWLGISLTAIVLVFEVVSFWRSPYMRKVVFSQLAHEQR